LFGAKQGEAEKIESLDSDILRKPSEIKRSILTCPRDQAELFRFDDRYFPKGIILERCPNCSGIWLNRGDFTKFQSAREELQGPEVKEYDDKEMEEEIEHILALHKDGDTADTLENLGRFLSTPIDRNTLLPLDSSENQPEAKNTASLALNILMLVLRALVLRS
jgi:Zn-finger nucleic acid-binding protein